jgi:hypothetical protein
MPHTVKLPNGKFLTGCSWPKKNPLFANLPFPTNLVAADDNMGDALGPVLALAEVDCWIMSALIICKNSFFLLFDLNQVFAVHGCQPRQAPPFQQHTCSGIDITECKLMLAPGTLQIGWGHANTIWALMSNFIALDCLCTTFSAATAAPSLPVSCSHCEQTIAIRTAAEVSISGPISAFLFHLNISSCVSSPHLQKYSENSASLGLLVKRLRSNLE